MFLAWFSPGEEDKRIFLSLTMQEKIITVEYAREKLGKRGKAMTDKEIENLLSTLRLLCSKTIDSVIEKKKT